MEQEEVTDVEWVDELPGAPYDGTVRGRPNRVQQRSQDLYDHAAVLRANPMRWAKYPRSLSTKMSAGRTASFIREGNVAAYHPAAGFQVCSRGVNCFIRYNPDAEDPHKTAYAEGYVQGRQDAMSEVHGAIWDFRQAVSVIKGWEEGRGDYRRRGTTTRPVQHGREQ